MTTGRTVLSLSALLLLVTHVACVDSTSPESTLTSEYPTAGAGSLGTSSLRIHQDVGTYVAVGSNFELTTNYSTASNSRGVPTVRWTSSEPGILSIGNSTGISRALQPGRATVTALHSTAGVDTMTFVVLDTVGLVVAPANTEIAVGDSVEFTVDAQQPVEWQSSDTTVVSISASGRAIGRSTGNATIVATTPIGTRGTTSLAVTLYGGGHASPTDTSTGGTKPPPSDTTSVPPPAPPGDTTSSPPPPRTPPAPSTAELPRVSLQDMVEEARAAPAARTITVSTSPQLQAALDTSKYGDEILVNPGVYVGSFVLRNKSGSGWITVRGKTVPSLPAAGERVRPSQSSALPVLQTSGSNLPTIRTEPRASGYHLVHLEIGAKPGVTTLTSLVYLGLGSNEQSQIEQAPGRIVIDRVYIHGSPELKLKRCISMHTSTTAIIDSWISECHDKGADSQAIASWNGPGPYLIVNNHLEGAGENVIFGGADPAIANLVPEDIEIRRNYFYKPPAWYGVWTVKNLLELKFGRRVVVEDNVFANNWADGQVGYAVLFKSVNQSGGAPWSETSDVTFRNNIIRNSANGINLAARPETYPAIPMSRVYIGQNSFESIGTGAYEGGRLWSVSGVDNTTIEHNTGVGVHSGLLLDGGHSANLTVRNNVFGTVGPRYGAWDWAIVGSQGRGTAGLNSNSVNWIVEGNVLTAEPSSAFPAGNSWPATGPSGLGVVSFPNNLRFLPSSQFINKGVDGVMPGVDFDVLAARTAGVVVPP